ncbi:MAG: hypothetical protein JW847_01410 [Candidatus Omnitrophica bacterium]|nr:hypothetical protein [Candidatus Omnitrophota bacterium]
MNKRAVILLIFLLVLIGIIIIGKQREQAIQLEQVETQAANELRRVAAEAQKARETALIETRRIEAEAERAKQEAIEKARIAEEEAQRAREMAVDAVKQKADEIQAKINELAAQSTALLDGGEYQKAIDMAQQILTLDPNSPEGQSIIERATAKLKEIAAQQIGTLTEGVQGTLEAPVDVPAIPGQ